MGNKSGIEDDTKKWANRVVSGMTDEEITNLRADIQKQRKR